MRSMCCLVVDLWDRSVLYEVDWINCARGMVDLISVIILLRSWNDIPLPVGFRHRGRPWHVNPEAVIEDRRVWSNRIESNRLSPCRSALDVIASFTTPVDIVSMHNLFLQEVVNGMVHVHVMYVCNPYVICESRFMSAGWSLGAVILLYNDLRVGFSM